MQKLLALTLGKAFLLFFLILSGYIPLAPDEAQYWTWSRALDIGYYSKPPLIAWQIALSTLFFGDTELAVRFGSLILGFAFPFAVASLVQEKNRFWAGALAALSPLGFYLSFAAVTDTGAILFFTLALSVLVNRLNPLYAGFAILVGALYKWIAFFFWPILGVILLMRKDLRDRRWFFAFLISLIALIPPIYWNISHDFATFQHVGRSVTQTIKSGNFFDFLGAQIALFSPLIFLFFLLEFFRAKTLELCIASFGLFILLFISLFKPMQPNWAAIFFPTAFALAGDRSSRYRVHAAATGVLFIAVALLIPLYQLKNFHPRIPYKANPFRQSMGNNCLSEILESLGYDPKKDFLFGDRYQMASLLSFYSPGQKRAYTFNISDSRKSQFSYWDAMTKEKGNDGFFAVIVNKREDQGPWIEKLNPYFEAVTFKGFFPLFEANGEAVRWALFFSCKNYNGGLPPSETRY